MVKSFRDLKKSREAMFTKLNQRMESENKGGRPDKDPRFWYPAVDKSGNGFAVIRFLPATQGEESPYVRIFNHGFKGPGGWYIEQSRTTLKGSDGKMEADPLGEYNQSEWQRAEKLESQGQKAEAERIKEMVRKRKRNTSYISNIYVVKDPANPENEGKVFLFRYGKQLYDKIADQMNPATEGEERVFVFDLDEGANLRIKIGKNKGGFRTYENSVFDSPSPLGKNEDEQEAIWNKQYPLQPFLDPSQFKSYDELKARLDRVLALNTSSARAAEEQEEDLRKTSRSRFETEDEDEDDTPPFETDYKTSTSTQETETDVDEDDSLDYYRRLAEGIE